MKKNLLFWVASVVCLWGCVTWTDQVNAGTNSTLPNMQNVTKGHQIPDYDIISYCKQVAAEFNEVRNSNEQCLATENEARDSLVGMTEVPDQVWGHCTRVAKDVGKSYAVLKDCIAKQSKTEKSKK